MAEMTRGQSVQELIFKWGRDGLRPKCPVTVRLTDRPDMT